MVTHNYVLVDGDPTRMDTSKSTSCITPIENGYGRHSPEDIEAQIDSIVGPPVSQRIDVRSRAMSVNTGSQTVSRPTHSAMPKRIHIPGSTGELNDLSTELEMANQTASQEQEDEDDANSEQIKEAEQKNMCKMLKFKLILFTSIVSMLMIAYCTTVFPWFLAYYHTLVFPLLYLLRFIIYYKRHWQMFCLDFCYFGNIGLLIFCWAFPQSEALFAVMYGAITGPMGVAVLIFRNSIVYHDYDRMTSAYIHLVPVTLVYLIRWFPAKCSQYWYYSYEGKTLLEHSIYTNTTLRRTDYLGIANWVDARWIWITIVPLAWFIVHTIFFMLVENTVYTDKKYLTSYKWLTSASKSAVYHILTLGGRVERPYKVKLLWLLFNTLYAALSVLGARLFYEYMEAHTAYVILLYCIAIYNGASFYIDVFSKRGVSVSNG